MLRHNVGTDFPIFPEVELDTLRIEMLTTEATHRRAPIAYMTIPKSARYTPIPFGQKIQSTYADRV
jgi:hypothetical protein